MMLALQGPVLIRKLNARDFPLYTQSTVTALMNPDLRKTLLLECRSGMLSWYPAKNPGCRSKSYP
jgi:hypothetical protein